MMTEIILQFWLEAFAIRRKCSPWHDRCTGKLQIKHPYFVTRLLANMCGFASLHSLQALRVGYSYFTMCGRDGLTCSGAGLTCNGAALACNGAAFICSGACCNVNCPINVNCPKPVNVNFTAFKCLSLHKLTTGLAET